MRINHFIKPILLTAFLVSVAGCSSHRHGGPGVSDANGMNGSGANGAYTEGAGNNGGFQPSASCNVPQTAGFNTQSYYFDFNSSDLHAEDLNRLQAAAQKLAGGNAHIRVVGNTDDRGSREFNVALGWRRANSIAATLEQHGVAKQHVTADSNGAEKPIAFGTSDDDYQCNRRVDIISSK